MTAEPRFTRRQVVVDLGRGGLAIALLTACSSTATSTPASTTGTTTSGVTSAAATTTGTTTSGVTSAAATGADGGSPVTWNRVNLGFVSAYVLVRGKQAAVVDTGVAGSADTISAVLDAAGPGWAGVRHVVLTHHHPDHAGSIADVLTRATSATGYIGEADLAQVTDSPRPLHTLADGQEVFGLRIIATPGHTAGHVSVFDQQSGLLVAGDALRNQTGLASSDPQYTADATAASASVKALAKLPVKTILFGHGEPLEANAAAALSALASSLG